MSSVLNDIKKKEDEINQGFERQLEVIRQEEELKKRRKEAELERIRKLKELKEKKKKQRHDWMLNGNPFNLYTNNRAI